MVTRRRLVAAAAAVVGSLSGCGSGLGSDELTPPPCPERPSPLTGENAGEFVQSFERAYAWHVALDRYEGLRDLAVHVDNVTVVSGDRGVVVHVDVFVGISKARVEADREYVASYHLDGGRPLRVEGNERGDPVGAGVAVRCPPA